MARADAAGTDRADALALLLTGGSPTATLPGSPSQHEIDRELSVFEASVEIAEALPEVPQ